MNKAHTDKVNSSRRDFLKTSTMAAVGTTLAASLPVLSGAYAAGSDEVKVGLIGCGGRGTGAAQNALSAAPGVKLIAMGDVFKDRLQESRKLLMAKHGDKVDVPEDRCFIGFDAYEKVLATDVSYVILATPPGFRPQHLKAAVAAGKHVFAEKPVAVDGTGIRTVLAVYEEAKKKELSIVAGTQNRHKTGYLETMKRLQDGAIGQIVSARCYYNTGTLWMKQRQPDWSDVEWQLRNWLYFTWLSGDHIVEQHVHNLDAMHWAFGAHPVRAVGTGGRQARTDPAYGHIYDHFTVDFEYENGVHLMSMCRQMAGCDHYIGETWVGTKGTCTIHNYTQYIISGETNWRFGDQDNDPYVQEHTDLIASLRAGKPINELKNVAESTLIAIMGRMSAYTGKTVTWEQAFNSKENLMPTVLAWGSLPVPPVAVPGQTQFWM